MGELFHESEPLHSFDLIDLLYVSICVSLCHTGENQVVCM